MRQKKLVYVFQFTAILSLIAGVMLYPSLGYSADPLKLVNEGVKSGVTTFQLIALSIAGVALIGTALLGEFTQRDKGKLLQIFGSIILIAGAVLFVDWVASFIGSGK